MPQALRLSPEARDKVGGILDQINKEAGQVLGAGWAGTCAFVTSEGVPAPSPVAL